MTTQVTEVGNILPAVFIIVRLHKDTCGTNAEFRKRTDR